MRITGSSGRDRWGVTADHEGDLQARLHAHEPGRHADSRSSGHWRGVVTAGTPPRPQRLVELTPASEIDTPIVRDTELPWAPSAVVHEVVHEAVQLPVSLEQRVQFPKEEVMMRKAMAALLSLMVSVGAVALRAQATTYPPLSNY